MLCSNGHENPDGQAFCGTCGEHLIRSAEQGRDARDERDSTARLDDTAAATRSARDLVTNAEDLGASASEIGRDPSEWAEDRDRGSRVAADPTSNPGRRHTRARRRVRLWSGVVVGVVVCVVAAGTALIANNGSRTSAKSAALANRPRTALPVTTTTIPVPALGKPCAAAQEGQLAEQAIITEIECVRTAADPNSGFSWFLRDALRQHIDYEVTLDSCKYDVISALTCTGRVTNLRKAPQTFVITLDVLDANDVRLSEDIDIENDVAAGATAQWQIVSMPGSTTNTHARVVSIKGTI